MLFLDPEADGPAVASRLCEENGILDGDVLVGASLGGMIACEIAKMCKIDTLYLVGSAVSRRETDRFLAVLSPLISMTHAGRCVEFIAANPFHLATTTPRRRRTRSVI